MRKEAGKFSESVNRDQGGHLSSLQILQVFAALEKKNQNKKKITTTWAGEWHSSQGSARFQFWQEVKQMLSYESDDKWYFADARH